MTDLRSEGEREGTFAWIAERMPSSLEGGRERSRRVVCKTKQESGTRQYLPLFRRTGRGTGTHDGFVFGRCQAGLSSVVAKELVGDRVVAAVVAVRDALLGRRGCARCRTLVSTEKVKTRTCQQEFNEEDGAELRETHLYGHSVPRAQSPLT